MKKMTLSFLITAAIFVFLLFSADPDIVVFMFAVLPLLLSAAVFYLIIWGVEKARKKLKEHEETKVKKRFNSTAPVEYQEGNDQI